MRWLFCLIRSGTRLSRRWPLMPPSITTWATCTPLAAVLARHALRDHAQARLGGRELREARLAAQAARGAGEDHRAAAEGTEPAGRLAPDEKAGEAADAPEVLEQLRA